MRTNEDTAAWSPDVHLDLSDIGSSVRLHAHQIAAHVAITKHFHEAKGKAGLIVVPTGGGKTVLAAHWLLKHHIAHGGRVLWLAHRRSLLRQALSTFHRLANVAYPHRKSLDLIALSSGCSRWAQVSPEHDVIFSSMQTAVMPGNAGFIADLRDRSPKGLFVVLDEAHHAPAAQSGRLLNRLKKELGCQLLGLTATPVRMDPEDKRRLSAIFEEKIVYQITRQELTDRGILAHASFETVKTEVNLEKDFTAEDHEHLARYGQLAPTVLARLSKHAHRNELIVDRYVQNKARYGSTIVFAADSLHASTLAGEFQKKGIDADYVDYSRPDAQEIIQRYQELKKPDVLVNVEMLTEGFDAPHTKTVFIARPTRSEGLLAQMVGRALRGRSSNGHDVANLVTFLDTWEQFNVLDTKYALSDALDDEKDIADAAAHQLVVIPPELVSEAYRMLQSNVRGQLLGVYQCLPHGWYTWDEEFEDDVQRRKVMVYDNQHEQLAALMAAFPTRESVPEEVTEEVARGLVQKFFFDIPDPLPRWADVKSLLDARRKGCAIHHFRFEEKAKFDPREIAQAIIDTKLPPDEQHRHMSSVWEGNAACRSIYLDDESTFREDVTREYGELLSPPRKPAVPEIVRIVPTTAPRPWPEGERGYSLVGIRDGVVSAKRNFPNGGPRVSEIRWSKQVIRHWGFFRYEESTITINCVLNSPEVPLFVLEFLMFHEMLHGDMPGADHNRDFKRREHLFVPSVDAIADATRRGIKPGPNGGMDFWRVRGDMFLDTFNRYFARERPGSTVDCSLGRRGRS
jgi:superfamily II DNA or RNA helicase